MYKGSEFFREIEENCYRGEKRLQELDEMGIAVQVLSTVPVMFSYWAKPEDTLDLSRFLNDHLASVVATSPDRFIGLATIPMQHPEFAVQELTRCMKELQGFVGIQIGSHCNDTPLSDPIFNPIWEACEQLGASIFIHPWDMPAPQLMKKYWLPWLVGMPSETCFAICSFIFGGIFDRYPNLKVCFAHGGGSFPGTIGRIEHGWKVRPDLCAQDCKLSPREYCGKFYVDSLVHDQGHLDTILELLSSDKIILGSDYPFPLGEDLPGEMIENYNKLNDSVKAKLLWDNGIKFLGLEQREKQLLQQHEQMKQRRQEKQNKQQEEQKEDEITQQVDKLSL